MHGLMAMQRCVEKTNQIMARRLRPTHRAQAHEHRDPVLTEEVGLGQVQQAGCKPPSYACRRGPWTWYSLAAALASSIGRPVLEAKTSTQVVVENSKKHAHCSEDEESRVLVDMGIQQSSSSRWGADGGSSVIHQIACTTAPGSSPPASPYIFPMGVDVPEPFLGMSSLRRPSRLAAPSFTCELDLAIVP
jgi:hypothetical protein